MRPVISWCRISTKSNRPLIGRLARTPHIVFHREPTYWCVYRLTYRPLALIFHMNRFRLCRLRFRLMAVDTPRDLECVRLWSWAKEQTVEP